MIKVQESIHRSRPARTSSHLWFNLNVLQTWVCNVENKMISVERVLQLTKIPCEAPLDLDNCRPETIDWPFVTYCNIKSNLLLEDKYIEISIFFLIQVADLLKLKKSGKHEFSNFIAAEGRK